MCAFVCVGCVFASSRPQLALVFVMHVFVVVYPLVCLHYCGRVIVCACTCVCACVSAGLELVGVVLAELDLGQRSPEATGVTSTSGHQQHCTEQRTHTWCGLCQKHGTRSTRCLQLWQLGHKFQRHEQVEWVGARTIALCRRDKQYVRRSPSLYKTSKPFMKHETRPHPPQKSYNWIQSETSFCRRENVQLIVIIWKSLILNDWLWNAEHHLSRS